MASSDPIDAIVDQLDSITGPTELQNATETTQQNGTGTAKTNDSFTANNVADANGAAVIAPKKKKKKRKGGKGKTLPTGFEENFTEAPLTPAQFAENKELYDISKPVAERIETAVQKYRAKRKFTGTNTIRDQLLTDYLITGGINTAQKQFGGVDEKFIREHDAEDIAKFKATDYVPEKIHKAGIQRLEELDDNYEEPEYKVDFNYVVRGFLTHRIPFCFGMKKTEDVDVAVSTIRNFLNWLLYNSVCPEYTENIHLALATCQMAARELPICSVLSNSLPGDFNKACSTLFGGYWSIVAPKEWDKVDGEDVKKEEKGFTKEEALDILGTLIAELQVSYDPGELPKQIYKEYASLQVMSVWLPEPGSPLKLGKIYVQPWTPEEATPIESKWGGPDGLTLYCEKTIVQYAYPGMHLCCTLHEMDNGLIYFDELTGVMCSDYLEIRDEKELEVDSEDFDYD
ncbi:hypothetical protein TWF694_009944 [Orbilia ellipsospora]|uniref:Uncharacterized protein n=1 Tax=Orbilia ellipsospora TaxID=2528407 RepID=A0AAV9XIT2_9PEZI